MSQGFRLKADRIARPSALVGMKQWVEMAVLAALPAPDADFVHLCSEALLHGMDKAGAFYTEDAVKAWVTKQIDRFVMAHGQSLRIMSENSSDVETKTTTTDDGVIVSANKYAPSVAEVDKAMEMVRQDKALFGGRVRVAG